MSASQPSNNEQLTPGPLTTRRATLKAAAWGVPAIAVAAAAPSAAASPPLPVLPTLGSLPGTSVAGIGWYRISSGSIVAGKDGIVQFDTHANKNMLVNGTVSGDVISNVHFRLLVSTAQWGTLNFQQFFPVSGSSLWSGLATGGLETVAGVQYRVYTASYSGTITATGTQTFIYDGTGPNTSDFYYRARHVWPGTPTGFARAYRYVTVKRAGFAPALVTSGGGAIDMSDGPGIRADWPGGPNPLPA